MIIVENVAGCESCLPVANRHSDHVVFIPRYRHTDRLGGDDTLEYRVNTPVSVLQVSVLPRIVHA